MVASSDSWTWHPSTGAFTLPHSVLEKEQVRLAENSICFKVERKTHQIEILLTVLLIAHQNVFPTWQLQSSLFSQFSIYQQLLIAIQGKYNTEALAKLCTLWSQITFMKTPKRSPSPCKTQKGTWQKDGGPGLCAKAGLSVCAGYWKLCIFTPWTKKFWSQRRVAITHSTWGQIAESSVQLFVCVTHSHMPGTHFWEAVT